MQNRVLCAMFVLLHMPIPSAGGWWVSFLPARKLLENPLEGREERRALADVEAFEVGAVEVAVARARRARGRASIGLQYCRIEVKQAGDSQSHAELGERLRTGPVEGAVKVRMREAVLDHLPQHEGDVVCVCGIARGPVVERKRRLLCLAELPGEAGHHGLVEILDLAVQKRNAQHSSIGGFSPDSQFAIALAAAVEIQRIGRRVGWVGRRDAVENVVSGEVDQPGAVGRGPLCQPCRCLDVELRGGLLGAFAFIGATLCSAVQDDARLAVVEVVLDGPCVAEVKAVEPAVGTPEGDTGHLPRGYSLAGGACRASQHARCACYEDGRHALRKFCHTLSTRQGSVNACRSIVSISESGSRGRSISRSMANGLHTPGWRASTQAAFFS